MKSINRRLFLKESSMAAAGICLAGAAWPLSCQSRPIGERTTAGLIQSPKVWDGDRLDPSVIFHMLDRGVQAATGSGSPEQAWNSLFNSKDIVALKVNCLGKETGSTKPELAYAVAQSLHKYVNMPLENIIIFDRSNKELQLAGYTVNRSGKGVQAYETPGFSAPLLSGDVKTGLSTIITDRCTALINLPLLKTHRGSKLTLSLKNHYGSIPTEVVQSKGFHRDGKFERIVHVSGLSPITDKTRLCIADGLMAQYDQGPKGNPKFQWPFSGLIMGTDPVAVDTIGLQMINDKRVEMGMDPQKVRYLRWAAQEGLGQANPDAIDLIREVV